MNLFTRLFIFLAVVAFAATPIMACCMTGNAQSGAQAIQAEAPPCHGDLAAEAAEPMSGDTPADCPSFADCESTMLAVVTADQVTVLSSADNHRLLPVEVNLWTGHEAPRIQCTTGPPRASPGLLSTPISMKQRLLV